MVGHFMPQKVKFLWKKCIFVNKIPTIYTMEEALPPPRIDYIFFSSYWKVKLKSHGWRELGSVVGQIDHQVEVGREI